MGKKVNKKHNRLLAIIVFFCLILVLALLIEGQITWILARSSADKSTDLLLNHIETVLDNNTKSEESQTQELKESYISYAKAIAYMISAKPEVINDIDQLKDIAELEMVDEIHIFDQTGTIIAGTVPAYYGYSFDSGEQMGYFKPMLTDKSLSMCQDITPNTAEGKSMMYAIAWNQEGTQMIQVGIEPKRLLAELRHNSIENVINNIPLSAGFVIYAIDEDSYNITASTDEEVVNTLVPENYRGISGSKETHTGSGIIKYEDTRLYCNYRPIGDYIIAVTYSMSSSNANILLPMAIIAIYLLIAGIMIFLLIKKVFKSEEKLENTVRQLEEDEEIIRTAGHGIWKFHLNSAGYICGMTVNDQWRNIFGRDRKDMTREECLAYFVDGLADSQTNPAKFDYSALDFQSVIRLTFAWNHPQKGTIYVEIAGAKHIALDGETQISGYACDVTESALARKKWENELVEAKNNAEAANSAKTSFLFNMSHDIRTPMNAIIGFRNLLEKHQEDPEKRADYLDKIKDSSGILLSIINNVLEMARIEKGTLEIAEEAWSAEQFNDTLYSVFAEMMEEKGLDFTRQIIVENKYVFCDPIKLREVFINILSNAYKYTNPGGSVHMLLEEIPSEREGYAFYRTTISDTGMGMSEEFLPHIFEEFAREKNTTEAKIEGTGLGMPIVKRLVELMDGSIEVYSKQGEGSTFIVTIPHKIAARSDLVEKADVQLNPELFKDKRILLAEDNDLNAEIAFEILGEAGFLLERAEDGKIACEKLENAGAGYYDLILMDIQMPGMNGYEATKAIRNMADPQRANIPIIAMTANAFEEDRREAVRAGMNGHLAKPINVSELFKTLAGILG